MDSFALKRLAQLEVSGDLHKARRGASKFDLPKPYNIDSIYNNRLRNKQCIGAC